MLRIVVSDVENSMGGDSVDVMVEGDSADEVVKAYLSTKLGLPHHAYSEKPDNRTE